MESDLESSGTKTSWQQLPQFDRLPRRGTAAAWGEQRREPVLDQDLQLIERCLGGEEAAWEDLVKVHTRRVYAICYRFTGSDHEAQDLTQDVFLRVFRSLKSFRAGEGSFTVWLSTADA